MTSDGFLDLISLLSRKNFDEYDRLPCPDGLLLVELLVLGGGLLDLLGLLGLLVVLVLDLLNLVVSLLDILVVLNLLLGLLGDDQLDWV